MDITFFPFWLIYISILPLLNTFFHNASLVDVNSNVYEHLKLCQVWFGLIEFGVLYVCMWTLDQQKQIKLTDEDIELLLN